MNIFGYTFLTEYEYKYILNKIFVECEYKYF